MKTALVTGAGTGIGLATAKRFLESGVAVVGIGRRAEKLAAVHALPGADEIGVETLTLDVRDDDAPARAVEAALTRFGRLDYLVNNAGTGSPKPVHEAEDADLDDSLAIMLRAPFRFTRAALEAMPEGGAIVYVSSTFALVGGLRGGAYSAAKAGLIGLSNHVACQYGSSGIRSNVVAPGVIPTEMTKERLDDERFRRMNDDMTPAKGHGQPEDVANLIVFLCSDAARWINGQTVAVDGGWSTTKFLSETALTSERTEVDPDFHHAGKQRR
ncbi:SDR family NAD(P)-dependent oxidoreductase [Amorphus sp. 3PC139-8]|uniref:SDR family NAD(P)-dependent oxidoreductase n=1 Tax=Amorphus sp. 3PC139-8 TaxID=2735676 RepID=UPI00345D7FFC